MSKHTVKLLRQEEIAAETMAFYFEKPEGFNFKAGQYGDWTLIDPIETDSDGPTRTFTFASAPYEKHLMFATRMRNTAFKRVLRKMEPGTEIKLEAPFGSFVLHNKTDIPAVFLVGGIGVTPVRSIVLQAAHEQLPHRLYVFYANNTPEDAAYLAELMAAGESNPNYTFVGTMAEPEKSGTAWFGETGFVTEAMLVKHINDLALPIYYIVGPPAMVQAMRELLNDAGVNDDNIRTEEFSGY
jgi:ferredoxin-NADP reductase